MTLIDVYNGTNNMELNHEIIQVLHDALTIPCDCLWITSENYIFKKKNSTTKANVF